MQLLDQILAADDQSLWASASTTETRSSCWGIEYLGQATAAFFTLIQLQGQLKAQLSTTAAPQAGPATRRPVSGMLIGSRHYQAYRPQLEANCLLLMQVSPRAPSSLSSPVLGGSGLVKFQGNLWQLESNALSQLPLSTSAYRLPYDTTTLAELNGQLLIEGDLSVYIPPQQHSANSS
jgi:hypothetical protein